MGRKGRFAAKVKQKSRQSTQTARSQGHLKSSMRSSWVEYYEWVPNNNPDNDIGSFYMKVKRGKKYEWPNVSKAQAGQAIGGNATCDTDDATGQRRWFIGKNPSLGAAYHKIAKYFRVQGITTTTQPSSAYFDISTEGYVPKYNIDQKRKRGRPSKADVYARDWAWAGRYA